MAKDTPIAKTSQSSALEPLSGGCADRDDQLRRLASLAGLPCPRCGQPMVMTGSRLMCQDGLSYGATCFYSFSRAECAEDELLPH